MKREIMMGQPPRANRIKRFSFNENPKVEDIYNKRYEVVYVDRYIDGSSRYLVTCYRPGILLNLHRDLYKKYFRLVRQGDLPKYPKFGQMLADFMENYM